MLFLPSQECQNNRMKKENLNLMMNLNSLIIVEFNF